MPITITETQPIDTRQTWETPEDIVAPELPIVDPHHHLWDIRTDQTEPRARFEQKVYLCEGISNDIKAAGHNIVQIKS